MTQSLIDKKHMVQTFLDLARIGSHSKKEGKVADYLEKLLQEMGLQTWRDSAGKEVGGETGNLIAALAGTGEPWLLSSHMDTVIPGENVKPIAEEHRIRSDGTTILGADCKAGLAVVCEALRTLLRHKFSHPPIEIAFTICEEIGLLGAKHLDVSKISAKTGLVLDSEFATHLTTRAPAADRMEFVLRGLEAHAGVCPEKGISAIQIAARAIASMRLGRIDEETTANIGVIEGGGATNIVTPQVRLKGEARSHSVKKLDEQTRHMKECLEKAAKEFSVPINGKKQTGALETNIQRDFTPLIIPEEAPIVSQVQRIAKKLGKQITCVTSGGGSDANIFHGHGILTPNLGCGMREIHTVREWLDLEDFFFAADLLLEVLKD
ncbi:MAG: M20/M25/M40 family metallo-hydrolase [Elusimicrobia bacterium]|nr:M20/M25/M40 family metallo-hydrolase [Elusimicrobiota bacterium]